MKLTVVVLCAILGLAAAASVPNTDIFRDWEGRIVGGTDARLGQFPYQASLRTAANGHFCGGWVHNNRWIVSAAHCTIGRGTANTVIVVGALDRQVGGTRYETNAIVNHPEYNANTLANDISAIQTRDQIQFDATVQPIALSTVNTPGGVAAIASGWGQTSVSVSGYSGYWGASV